MNTSKLPIICFHGSPGIPEEFNDVIKLLPKYRFITFPRNGYPKDFNQVINFSENASLNFDTILLGYSWGNVPALQYAYKNLTHIKGIIIISPYLYPSQKSSIRLIFSIPLLRTIVLKFLGKKIINSMLLKSSSPTKVPLSYQRLARVLSQPKMIYTAITEKQPLNSKILKKIALKDIPVVLVWGENDLTGKEREQILPIKHIITNLKEIRLKNAGHAIPFTKPNALAKVINDFIMEKQI